MNVNVLLRSLVKTCSMLVQMLSLSWQLTLLTCVEMPLLGVLQNYYNVHHQVIDHSFRFNQLSLFLILPNLT